MKNISPFSVIKLQRNIAKKLQEEFHFVYGGYRSRDSFNEMFGYFDKWLNVLGKSCLNYEKYFHLNSYGNPYDFLFSNFFDDHFSFEDLYKIAYDLGLETPECVFAVPEIIKIEKQETIERTLESALKQAEKNPHYAVLKAVSFCELFLKRRAKEYNIAIKDNAVLKEISGTFFDNLKKEISNQNQNLKQIKCQLLENFKCILCNIADLRNSFTDSHGNENKLLSDVNLAIFVINQIATICYFVRNQKTEKQEEHKTNNINDCDIYDDDIPF